MELKETALNSWKLVYDGFKPDDEGLREALYTLGNGYFATRGAAAEAESDAVHYPGTYLAGGYNRLKTEIAGRTVENEDLVNFPNWLLLKFSVSEGNWFDPDNSNFLCYRQELDMYRGILVRTLRFRDGENRITKLRELRFVHMDCPHLAGIIATLTAENWSGGMRILSAVDGTVLNHGVKRYRMGGREKLEIALESSESPGREISPTARGEN